MNQDIMATQMSKSEMDVLTGRADRIEAVQYFSEDIDTLTAKYVQAWQKAAGIVLRVL
jgi:hypothetical protein